jgi:hypothetical protein
MRKPHFTNCAGRSSGPFFDVLDRRKALKLKGNRQYGGSLGPVPTQPLAPYDSVDGYRSILVGTLLDIVCLVDRFRGDLKRPHLHSRTKGRT